MSGLFKKNRRVEAGVSALGAEHDEARGTVANVDVPVANRGQEDEVAIGFPVRIAADGALGVRPNGIQLGDELLDVHGFSRLVELSRGTLQENLPPVKG
jgi:hypothetical protein